MNSPNDVQNKWNWQWKTAIVASLTFLGVAIGSAIYFKLQIVKPLTDAASAITAPLAPMVQNMPMMQFGTLTRPTTVLFMGTDMVYADPRRREMERDSTRGNSDTLMLAFLNPYRHTVSVLHIPRDTEAYVGQYGIRKINSANVLGGPDLAKQTVSQLLDVPIDHYVIMNIQGLVELVNELHGITVNVPKRMSYMDWTGKLKIDLQPGFHTLTGNQAMGFVRFRHDALGDIGRIQRQEIFLQAVLKKALDPTSWLHVPALVEIARRNLQTDMSNIDIFEALNFIHSVPRENVKFVMLPGQFAGNGDWLADTNSKAVAQRLANPDEDVITSRHNISVCVVNATNDKTFGSQVARALRKLGYVTCVGADDPDGSATKTKIIAQFGSISNAKMMQHDLGDIGEVITASIGNLTTALTIIAHDDLKLDKINLSSADLPYIPPTAPPQPLVVAPSALNAPSAGNTEPPPPDASATPGDEEPATSGMGTATETETMTDTYSQEAPPPVAPDYATRTGTNTSPESPPREPSPEGQR
jgi:LCP family protein required for cell wall assembly